MKLFALKLIAALSLLSASAFAQCTSCAAPAATYAVASPVVMQTVPQRDGWYPGKYIGELLFGRANYTTNYAPTYGYTAAYTPAYTAAYAPAYTAAYAPAYTAAYAPAMNYTAAYAPTYPPSYLPQVAAYAPTSYVAAYPAMQTVQSQVVLAPACDACATAYRPVTMEPVTACDTCSACSGVATASYDAPLAPSCPSCAAQSPYIESAPATTAAPPQNYYPEPQPAVPADMPVDDRSLLNKPVVQEPADAVEPPASEAEEAATESSFFQAPQLFAPKDRVTQRTLGAPVRQAVYSAPVRTAKPKAVGGWVSAE